MRVTESKRRYAAAPLRWNEINGGRSRPGRARSPEMRLAAAGHSLAADLIRLHEAENQRFAAELHDGIIQDVAAIAIDLGVLARDLPRSQADIRSQILRIQERAFALSNEVRSLSHNLHPSVLERLGLSNALRVYCGDFERRESIQVNFVARNVGGRFPAALELALYRICQEALCNVKKHSRAATVTVKLEVRNRGMLLSVADAGCGFDLCARAPIGGIGLISMRDRVRLAGGQLVIRSGPNIGTEIEAFIPIKL